MWREKKLEPWKRFMEKAFEHQKLQQNQINDITADTSKKSVTVISNTNNSRFSVKPEFEIQTSKEEKHKKISLENNSAIDSFKKGKYNNPHKVKNNEREKLLESYLRNSAEKRRTNSRNNGFSKTESEVGITEYVFRNQGFTSTRFRYKGKDKADFQVKPFILDAGAYFPGERKDHYTIALRNVIGDQSYIEMCLKSLKDFGFINYYETHFGNNYLIGKELLLEHWQEAVDLILEEWLVSRKPTNFALACFVYTSSRDILKALSMIANYQMDSVPSKLLFSIKQHGENLAEALDTIPLKLRQSYVLAYQYSIWNKIVSKRIAKFGLKLIIGDLVFAQGNDNNGQHNQREVLFIDDGNIHKYTIYDVVLPLPGSDIIYPANEDIDWYDDLFKAEGISKMDFYLKSKTCGLTGGYRPMILRPFNLKWKFVRYDHPRQKLFLSDLEQLLGHPPVGSLLLGAYLGLVLQFNLPAFASVSMALREILKKDINEATVENQNLWSELCTNQKRPVGKDLQIKEANDNLCRISALPVSKINNSLLGFYSPLDKQLSRDNLVEQPIPCPPSTNESQLIEIPLEKTDTILNLPPATKKPFEQPQVKKEPTANERSSSIIKDSSEELQKERIIVECSTLNRMPQLIVNECLKEPQTKCIKQEPGISRTRPSTIKACVEEPLKKKIKTDPDAKTSNLSNFKSIIYIDLSSDEED